MTGLAAIAPLPAFEGLWSAASPMSSTLAGSGTQWSRAQVDGVASMVCGRLRITDRELAERASAKGLGAALSHGWRRHGPDLLGRLAGEFIVAVWDTAAGSGAIAVDRFSTLPLYFGERGGRVAFAMRPARVAELLEKARDIDPVALYAYAWFHEIPSPLSIFSGVKRLDAGQALLVDRHGARLHWHWQPAFDEHRPFEFGAQREAFMGALRAGVRECVDGVAHERLGCFLSGGTDSSTIAGLVSEAYGRGARTFSIGFDVSGYDESHYSRTAARRFGTDHTEHVLTPEEAGATLDVLAQAYEQPFGNSSAVPTHVCARIAREAGVERMLGGDGGDELYGGNERYATQWLLSLYGHVPAGLRNAMLEPLLFGPLKNVGFWPVRKARGYSEQARVPLPERLGAKYNLLNRFGAANVFTDDVLAGAGGFEPLELEREVWARSDGATQINRLLAFDFKFTLADNDLPKVTRMCHAAGVQVAFPMLTDPVVDHSLVLAPGQKLKRTHLRYFFREALRGFLPDEIIDKPKHGFGMPFGEWLLGQPALAARADDALASLADRGLVRRPFLAELRRSIQDHHAGYYGVMTWVLLMLELWMREHVDGASSRVAAGPVHAPVGEARP